MKKIILFIMMFIMMVSFIVAQPQVLDNNLVLETNFIQYHPLNTDFYLHTHVYNANSGLIIEPNELLCYYRLYDSNINWEHKDIGILAPYGAGLFTIIESGNFTEKGLYSMLFWCEAIEGDPMLSIGGFTQFTFEVVNQEGIFEFSLNSIYFMLIFAVALFILSIFIKQSLFGVFGAILMLFACIYLIPIIYIVGIIGVIVSLILGVLFAINI